MAYVFGLVVDNVHFAHVVDPQLAYDDVAHKGGYFAPRVVKARLFEFEM